MATVRRDLPALGERAMSDQVMAAAPAEGDAPVRHGVQREVPRTG